MISDNLKVSIITVSYNSADTIEQTIQSVLNQTYKNIEYIIIDGQSTDGTVNVVRKYERFIDCFVSESDNGIYDAMNKGITHATGDIIGILNSDDWYEEEAVAMVVRCFRDRDAELVYGKKWVVNKNGKRKCHNKQPLEHIWHTPVVPHSTVFVKREIYIKYGVFDTKYKIAADYELILRFYAEGVKFEYIDEMISNFRSSGISSVNCIQSADEAKKVALSYIDKCPDKEFALNQIERNCGMAKLRFAMERKPNSVCDFLKKIFPNIEEGIVIFGTGIWGERLYGAMSVGNIFVRMFVDNNSSKWNTELNGVMIQGLEKLRDYKGYVIVAVKNCALEICEQLAELRNNEMKWITLDEIQEHITI